MIINKIPNTNNYKIKIIKPNINIYNRKELEKLTQKIITKIKRKRKLEKLIILEIYPIKKYGTIIILKNIETNKQTNDIEVKIKIYTKNTILYKIDYPIIKEIKENINIYYYNKEFYIQIKKYIPKKKYLYLLEQSEITYQNTSNIINYGLKIKI